jgi:lysophospholipase L1-like esterase
VLAISTMATLGLSTAADAANARGVTTVPTTTTAITATTVFYLDIGASVSVGVQPTSSDPHGQPTRFGYANRLVALEAARGVTLQLTKLGCPGESTTTMMIGGDKCYKFPDNQLADAVAFLKAHHDQTGLVTLDLGFNDIAPCLRGSMVDTACVNQNIALLQKQLPQIISTLKAVAGPNVTFIGLNHYNPYLAKALNGSKGVRFAADSVVVLQQLNDTLQQVYSAYGVPLANVVKAFRQNTPPPTTGPNVRHVPANVNQACSLTWMCRKSPYGPNLHPNDAGYEAITDAIVALLPKW